MGNGKIQVAKKGLTTCLLEKRESARLNRLFTHVAYAAKTFSLCQMRRDDPQRKSIWA